jgi:hypothetical protein
MLKEKNNFLVIFGEGTGLIDIRDLDLLTISPKTSQVFLSRSESRCSPRACSDYMAAPAPAIRRDG